jgi:hypothetical protein
MALGATIPLFWQGVGSAPTGYGPTLMASLAQGLPGQADSRQAGVIALGGSPDFRGSVASGLPTSEPDYRQAKVTPL